jgi:adenylate cyclase
MSSYLTTTVQTLQDGAILIGHGALEHRIDVKSKDEFGRLAQAFNEMSENLMKAQSNLLLANKQLEQRSEQIEEQQKLSDRLLLNILPTEVALELQAKGTVEPRYFEDVTILFTDFVGFTVSTENLAAEELVKVLHEYFTAFDLIVAKYGLEKLKTIGDAYMCVGGMPVRGPSHAVDAVMAAFEMVHYVEERQRTDSGSQWSVRIGIHTGPVVAGVVGIQKFAFDIWGDSVNFASRMESSGAPNRINLSASTQMRVKDFYAHENRGTITTKDKREVDMFFVTGLLPTLLDPNGKMPPEKFAKRYRAYFQKELTAFPEFLIGRYQTEGA